MFCLLGGKSIADNLHRPKKISRQKFLARFRTVPTHMCTSDRLTVELFVLRISAFFLFSLHPWHKLKADTFTIHLTFWQTDTGTNLHYHKIARKRHFFASERERHTKCIFPVVDFGVYLPNIQLQAETFTSCTNPLDIKLKSDVITSCTDPQRVKSPAWTKTSPGGTSIWIEIRISE